MNDIALITAALAECETNGEPAVLATVVRTDGSTYRRAGARMLLRRDGTTVGAVSGGCLEADLVDRVDDLLAAGRAQLATYDTRLDDDLIWGLGLGCNGRVDVLLEPLAGAALVRARVLYACCRDSPTAIVLATVIAAGADEPQQVGDRLLVTEGGGAVPYGIDVETAPPELVADAREALAARCSAVREYAAGHASPPHLEVVHEVIAPPVSLLVCGAGADALPLVRLAAAFGWRVTIVDHRPDYARPERFPGATVRLIDHETREFRGGYDAAVVMSHHYERDEAQVRALLATDIPYVGVLGPRRRTERMIEGLGVGPDDAARLYAPVGLDIGAETPDEIALAVVAEVQSVRAGRRGGSLRERRGGIHEETLVPRPSSMTADTLAHCARQGTAR